MNEMTGSKLWTRRVATAALAACLLVVPATALGGKTLVDKDRGTGFGGVAVARGDVENPKKLLLTISAKPRHTSIDWSYTTRCVKNGETSFFPGPGDHKVFTDKAKIKEVMRFPVTDPESCDVQASGKLNAKSAKSVTVKILSVEP